MNVFTTSVRDRCVSETQLTCRQSSAACRHRVRLGWCPARRSPRPTSTTSRSPSVWLVFLSLKPPLTMRMWRTRVSWLAPPGRLTPPRALSFKVTTFYRANACNATHGIAVAILSVRPSDRCVYCDKTKQRTANILIPHETAITLVIWYQQWLVGDAPFPLKSALKMTHPPSKNVDFDRFPLITSQP